MLHGDKSYWVTFQEDLTERSNLEEQLRQAQKLEAVGQLTAGIAHDFNNLLTAISISAEMIKFVLPGNDPQLKKVDRILDAGQLAANLINQLMIFSKSQILEPKPLNLNEIVDHISKLLTRVIGEHIQFVFLPSRDLWPIKVDRTQIEQIVVNLAVNSRDAMVDGGILTIQTNNIFLDDTASSGGLFEVGPGEYVLLTISDTGVGMSDKVKEKIFEPFFTTKELGRGTGLGLATVYSIVKDIGGDIRVQSEVGQGTIFKIYIPRTEGLELVAPVIMELSSLPKGNETILLVEDEEGVRLPILEVLQMQGYTVLEAHDGREALEMARIHGSKIDLVLTDLVMPRLSGRSLVERLSESMQDLKIVYMSGYNDEEISHHGVLNSGVEFLQKPFDFPTLTQKIREVLDN